MVTASRAKLIWGEETKKYKGRSKIILVELSKNDLTIREIIEIMISDGVEWYWMKNFKNKK